MESLDKLIGVSEAYWHAHPDDERAFLALGTAYGNAAIIDDPRLVGTEALDQRAFALLRKRMWADEMLLKLKPNDAEYQGRLAAARYNFGLHLSSAESSRKHSSGTSRRCPWRRKPPRWIPTMFARNTRSRSIKRVLRTPLFKTGSIEKARALFLDSDRILADVFKRDNSLRTQYALGVNAVRLGELYAHLAETSRAGRSAQLDLWRQARDSLQRGVASLQNVTAHATLTSGDMIDVTDGVASLARVDATLAKLGK